MNFLYYLRKNTVGLLAYVDDKYLVIMGKNEEEVKLICQQGKVGLSN